LDGGCNCKFEKQTPKTTSNYFKLTWQERHSEYIYDLVDPVMGGIEAGTTPFGNVKRMKLLFIPTPHGRPILKTCRAKKRIWLEKYLIGKGKYTKRLHLLCPSKTLLIGAFIPTLMIRFGYNGACDLGRMEFI